MSSFDMNEYLNRRIGTADKTTALQSVAAEKRQALEDTTWTKKLGLAPTGFLGSTVNLGASLASGATRLVGHVASLPSNAGAFVDDLMVPDVAGEAYSRYVQGNASTEDVALLNIKGNRNTSSPLEILQRANKARETGRAITNATDFTGIVDQTKRNQLSADLGSDFQSSWDQTKKGYAGFKDGHLIDGTADAVSGIAKLIFNAGEAAVTNPGAASEYIVENLPQLAVGAVGKGGMAVMNASIVGYGADLYQQGVENYQKEHNGEYPPADVRQTMAMHSAGAIIAESAGAHLALAFGKAAKITKGSTEAEAAAVRTGFKESLKNTAKATAGGFGSEGLTEGYQTYAEGEATLKPATAKEIYTGGVIGGLAGAGLSGGMRAVSEVAQATPEHVEKRAQEATTQEAQVAAMGTGDTSTYLDKTKATFDPVKGLQVMYGNSQLDSTTPEAKQAHLEQANKVISDLEDQRNTLHENSPEGLAENIKMLANEEAKLAAATSPAEKADAKEMVDMLKAGIETTQKMDDVAKKNNANALAKIDQQLAESRPVKDSLEQLVHGTSVEDAVTVADTTPDAQDEAAVASHKEAVDHIINLSMASPDRVSPAVASQLANNKANGLTDEQRNHLRTFSEARIAENTLKTSDKVSQDIYFGSNEKGKTKYVGIAQYNAQMSTAIAAGNAVGAKRALTGLTKFAEDHQAKSDIAQKALDTVKGRPAQIIRNQTSGSWMIAPVAMKSSDVRKNGGLTLNSPKLVSDIAVEAGVISKSAAAAKSAYEMKFKPVVKVVSAPTVNSVTAVKSVTSVDSQVTTVTPAASLVNQSNNDSTVDTAKGVDKSTAPSEATAQDSAGTAPETGNLVAMSTKSDEGTEYKKRNLLADYFTQTVGTDTGTQRPLVAIKDFLSKVADKTADVLSFVKLESLSDEQNIALTTFQAKAKAWNKTILDNLVRPQSKKQTVEESKSFYYKDLMQFLIQEDGSKLNLEENVKTAISYAAFSWIAENATRSAFNTPEEINIILGRDEDEHVSERELYMLGRIGTRQNVVANSLGQRAVAALGLKATKDAPGNLMPQLESVLGMHVAKLLLDQKILQRTTLTPEEMMSLTKSKDTSATAKPHFLRLVRDEKYKLSPQAEEIFQANKGTQGFLDKLFSVESGMKEPSFTPIPFEQKTTRNTKQHIPAKLAKIIEHENAVPNFVRQDMWQLVSQLGDDVALAIAGIGSVSKDEVHKSKRASIQAKNDGLIREYNNFKDYVGGFLQNTAEGLNQPLFFEHSVWKQQRVGIATNLINPQTSKIHRFLLYRQAWESKVDITNMENFKLRVLEGLGTKTDKQGNVKSLAGYDATVSAPKIVAAVAVLQKAIYEGGITADDQQTLLAGVKVGGGNFHSLDALVALAHYEQAKADGKSEFTVQMMGEIDGVTNGPMLSHLLMGAADTVKGLFGLLNRGGFYEQGSTESNYNVWRGEPGHLDLYETTTQHMMQAINTHEGDPVMAAVYAFTGELADKDGTVKPAGRKIVKTPLTAMIFGSSIGSAIDSMKENFIESIYGAIEDVAKGKASKASVLNHLKVLGVSLDANTDLMELEFNPGQIARLKESFQESIGEAVQQVMEVDFAAYMAKRKEVNKAAQLSFELYNAAYIGLLDQYKQELVDKGDMAINKDGAPTIHDLTAKQDAELRRRLEALLPIVHTPMSKDSHDLSSGLAISKSARKFSDNATHKSEVKFGNAFDDGSQSTNINSYERAETGPGVAMAVMLTHSNDTAISHTAADGNEVLNVHDAHGTGLDTFQQTAHNLNKATWDTLLNYSPASEMYDALARTVQGLAALLQKKDTPPAVLEKLASALVDFAEKNRADSSVGQIILQMVMTKETAYQADNIKLGVQATMASVDQYALEGGNYSVTDKDRAKAAEMQSKLSRDISPKENAAMQFIENLLDPLIKAEVQKRKIEKTKKKEHSREEETSVSKVTKPTQSPWGELGTPTVKSSDALVKLFDQRGELTAERAIVALVSRGNLSEANQRLLGMLKKIVDPKLVIKYVTPKTPVSEVLEKGSDASRGWYVSKGDKEAIYVLSPEFKHSGLTGEVLLHEMIHASLARTVEKELASKKANPNYTSPALDLVNELESLLKQAKAFVKDSPDLLASFEHSITNVHELIAYGMSNKAFQERVLQPMKMKNKTKGNVLLTGLQKFIDTITNLLFGDKRTHANTGMGVLLSSVSGLFQQAAQTKGEANIVLNHAMPTPNTYTTADLYTSLSDGTIVGEFDTHLRNLLGGIVEKLHGPFGSFKESRMKNQALTAQDVWLKALDEGVAPFASQSLAAGFKISDQEAFVLEQVEATVRAALDTNQGQTSFAYSELSKLYLEAKAKIDATGKDFKTGDPKQDQALYDFIFKMEKSNGDKSDYLARFAALGLAHQGVNNILKVTTDRVAPTNSVKTFIGRLENVFERILEWFAGRMTHTHAGQFANMKLGALVDQLVGIEAKQRAALLNQEVSKFAVIEDTIKDVSESIRDKVEELGRSDFIKNSKNAFVRAGGAVASAVAGQRVEFMLNAFNKLRDEQFRQGHGIAAGIINEVRGANDTNKVFHALLRESKRRDGLRDDAITYTGSSVLESFSNKGEDLTDKDKAAISAVFLRTDMSALLDHFTMAEIQDVLHDPVALKAAITKIEGQLTSNKLIKNFYVKSAKLLGYRMATGEVRGSYVLMNAGNIAGLKGTGSTAHVSTKELTAATVLLDQLITLRALEYTKQDHKTAAHQVMTIETARGNESGIEMTLKLHRELQKQSKERLFSGSETLMMKGYTPEIYDPKKEVLVADAVEGAQLVKMGYILVPGGPVAVDLKDPDRIQRHMYTRDGGGLRSHLTGIFSYTGKRAKGSRAASSNVKDLESWKANRADLQAMHNSKQADIQQMFANDPNFDPAKVKDTFTAPILDAQGGVVDYRYLMQESTKDNILNRDNRFEHVLGVLAGSIYDKETTKENNAKAVQALKDQYDAEYKTLSTSYVEVSPNSARAEFRDIYKMLPEDTKQSIKEIWGDGGMKVRIDLMDINFGYRKSSLTDAFEKDTRNVAEAFFVDLMTHLMGEKAAYNIRRAEDIWQELVHETKGILVIKSISTLMGNVISNTSALLWMGVPVKNLIRDHRVALKGATMYRKDSAELATLKTRIAAGHTQNNLKEMQNRVIQLEDSLARNPIKELVDAGLMPTIVEDVQSDNDIYSYKSRLVGKVERHTSKMNKHVLSGARTLYMAHDTKLYQTLNRATQLSDFLSRYVMYQHMTTKKESPMTKAAAIQMASDVFINYDVPSHRTVQFLNDMGAVWFTKYYMRIQKVIAHMYRGNPGRAIALMALGNYFNSTNTLMSSEALNHVHNPFSIGAFKYPGALGELATVKMGMGLFN